MNTKDLFYILKKQRKIVTVIISITVGLCLILTLLQPFEYRASFQFLVIQKQTENLDVYMATRSAEKLSENLSKIIYTSSFFEKVMALNPNLKNNFSKNEIKKRKEWRKKIIARVSPQTGMLQIDVYDKSKKQTKEFAKAIAQALITKGQEYHGGGKNVEIKLVDAPLISYLPVRPNILLNLFTGLVLGTLTSFGYAIVNVKQTVNDKQMTKNKKQSIISQIDRILKTDTQLSVVRPEIEYQLSATEKEPVIIKTMQDYLGRK